MIARGRIGRSFRAFGTVFRNRDLRLLELAFVGFGMAEWATWIAILVFAYDQGGPTEAGLVALIQLAPSAVVAPFASILGDRYPRRRVIVGAYLVQSVTMGATALALAVGWPVPIVYTLAAAAATSITLIRPAQGAALPTLARSPDELTAANAASGTIESLAFLAGPAAAGVLLSVSGPGLVLGAMACLLLISAFLAARIRSDGAGDPLPRSGLRDFVSLSAGGFRALAADPDSRLVVVLTAGQSLVVGALDVLIVALAIGLLGMGQPGVAWLTAALGGGGLVGAAAAILLVGRRLASPFGFGIVLLGLPVVALGVFPSRWGAFALVAAAGGGRVLVDVAGRTLLQRVVPNDVLARVFGIMEGLYMAALGAGSIMAAALIGAFGVRGALLGSGAFLPAVALALWRRLLRLDARADVPVRELEVLRSVPMLSVLPGPVIERLASTAVMSSIQAGAVVIRQGEPGDRFYIVAQGQMEVSVDGRSVETIGPGGSFGEIALLRDVPRTATVVARADGELLALDRDEFLWAVTGHPPTAEKAEAMIRDRLAVPGDDGSR